jgi:hypothetical protein
MLCLIEINFEHFLGIEHRQITEDVITARITDSETKLFIMAQTIAQQVCKVFVFTIEPSISIQLRSFRTSFTDPITGSLTNLIIVMVEVVLTWLISTSNQSFYYESINFKFGVGYYVLRNANPAKLVFDRIISVNWKITSLRF